jgi:hypothetical protein
MMAVSFAAFGVDRGPAGEDSQPLLSLEGRTRVHLTLSRFRDLQGRPLVLLDVPGIGAVYVTAADLANAALGMEVLSARVAA